MKTPINPWNVFAYLVGPAALVGFAASAIPALADSAHVTAVSGFAGVAVGAAAGLVVGLVRRFQ